MGVLDNIKRKLSDFSFSRKESPNREVKAINIKQAQTVGIVYRGDDDEAKELVERYVKFLKSYNIKCKTLGYYNADELPLYVTPKLEYDYFLKKDLNWKLEATNSEVTNFIEQKFDVLIDLSVSDDEVLRFVTRESQACFKVGGSGLKDGSDLDFALKLQDGDNLRSLMKGIDNYLHLINKE